MSPSSSRCWIASVSTRRTSPVSCMSTPSTHAHRLGRQVVAARHAIARAGHRRVREAERQQRLDARAHLARGLEHAVHRFGVGHAHAMRVAARDALLRQDRLDLRPAAVHDDQADAQAVQQVEVVHDAEERVVGDDLAAESDDERLAAKRVHVRRGSADPVHERAHRRGVARGVYRRSAWHRIVVHGGGRGGL